MCVCVCFVVVVVHFVVAGRLKNYKYQICIFFETRQYASIFKPASQILHARTHIHSLLTGWRGGGGGGETEVGKHLICIDFQTSQSNYARTFIH